MMMSKIQRALQTNRDSVHPLGTWNAWPRLQDLSQILPLCKDEPHPLCYFVFLLAEENVNNIAEIQCESASVSKNKNCSWVCTEDFKHCGGRLCVLVEWTRHIHWYLLTLIFTCELSSATYCHRECNDDNYIRWWWWWWLVRSSRYIWYDMI